MTLLQRAQSVLTTPTAYFQSIRPEKALGTPVTYLLVLSAIFLCLRTLLFTVSPPTVSPEEIAALAQIGFMPQAGSAASGFATAIFTFALSFVNAGLLHLFARLLRGQGAYVDTYKAVAYSMTPQMLLSSFPYIGILGSLYSLYLLIKGLGVLHGMSLGRAILTLVLAALTVIIIVLVPIFFFLFMLAKGLS
ncbi:MAG: YIP1 family protein [Candidatus Peregrinibacteria bacterium]|nr:YIP1 family protein [Candidatus Peregrinibacteria bacterium]